MQYMQCCQWNVFLHAHAEYWCVAVVVVAAVWLVTLGRLARLWTFVLFHRPCTLSFAELLIRLGRLVKAVVRGLLDGCHFPLCRRRDTGIVRISFCTCTFVLVKFLSFPFSALRFAQKLPSFVSAVALWCCWYCSCFSNRVLMLEWFLPILIELPLLYQMLSHSRICDLLRTNSRSSGFSLQASFVDVRLCCNT